MCTSLNTSINESSSEIASFCESNIARESIRIDSWEAIREGKKKHSGEISRALIFGGKIRLGVNLQLRISVGVEM
jgi:hypothetical protein